MKTFVNALVVNVLFLILIQLVGTHSYANDVFEPVVCLGECVGQGNVRSGGECFNDNEVRDLPTVLPTLEANGTRCAENEQIIGVQVIDTVTVFNTPCKRIDKFYCDTTIQGFYTGYRIDHTPAECFNVEEASNLRKLVRTIKRNGTECLQRHDRIVGVKLHKIGDCYRPFAVYCSRPH